MENQIKSKILSVKNYIGNRKIIIWGASEYGEQILKEILDLGLEVKCFVDSNSSKLSNLFCNRNVFSPEYLIGNNKLFYVFIAMNYYHSVKEYMNYHQYQDMWDYMYFLQKTINNVVENIQDYSDSYGNEVIGKPYSKNSVIKFYGENNKIIFGDGVVLDRCNIRFDCNDGYCYIGDGSSYKGHIVIALGSKFVIGKSLTVTSNCLISAAEYTEINICNDCMFASNNQIRTSDSHPIFSIHTGKRVNKSKSIIIGNHVWLAWGAVLLSGVKIGDGSVIGLGSIVKNNIPNNCVAVGIPAKVIKKDIAWEKSNLALTKPYYFPNGDYVNDKSYWNETDNSMWCDFDES